jgi:ATP/maltotriose-dependent transcriptional regulator MalT
MDAYRELLRITELPAGGTSPVAGIGHVGIAEVAYQRGALAELEVLHLLASGAPNQRIADDLVVTLDTVKKHVTHVLGKLGAANRTEAVTRARQLGLIS